jgi:hypothetical protein
MNKQDRQKFSIFGVLLGVLGLTLFLGYRLNQTTTAAVQPPETKTSVNPPAPSDARIRMDLVEKPEADQDTGKKNPFEYRQAPPPPAAQRGTALTGPSQAAALPPGVIRQTAPPMPPGPPPIPLKYYGYLTLDTPTGGFTAVIADDSRHYNVTVGEVLMGRYRILAITDQVVDVEDIQYNRRQSIPILK